MSNTIYATFADPDNAQKAAGALLDNGVRSEHISIILPEGYNPSSGKRDDGENLQRSAETGISTTTSADAGSGAAKGAGFGLIAGAIAALTAVFVPGIGLVIGGGALAIALGGTAGAVAAGAVAGGITGYLKDQGVPEDTILRYQSTLGSGGATITVAPTDEKITENEIQDIIAKYSGTTSVHVTPSKYLY